jgi:zinc protease
MAARAALLVVLLAACATGGSASTAPVQGPLRTVLPNGVVLIAQEHRASDVVALQLWFRVGGRAETADELGLSHYIEHMIFKGTPTRPVGSIDRMVEGLGGTSNAYTSYDYVHFDVVLPAREIRAGIDLLADIAVNASFPPDEITSEKKVVFEEMNVLEDDPDKALVRRLYELGYEPFPYGRPILGTRKDIEALGRDQLLRYYRKYYVPRNTVLVVVGAVAPSAVVPLVEAAFGKLTGGDGKAPSLPAVPALDRSRRLDVKRPEKQGYLGMAWRAPAVADEDVFAVDLLTYILGDSPSSRLNRVLRDQQNLVDQVDAGYGAWQLSGLATITARLDPANLDRVEASILEVLKRIREEGVTEAERQRAIISAESLYAFDIETAEGLAKTYGQAEVTYSLKDELLYLSRLRQITAAQIQAAARKYFGDANYARVRFLPQAGGAAVPSVAQAGLGPAPARARQSSP